MHRLWCLLGCHSWGPELVEGGFPFYYNPILWALGLGPVQLKQCVLCGWKEPVPWPPPVCGSASDG